MGPQLRWLHGNSPKRRVVSESWLRMQWIGVQLKPLVRPMPSLQEFLQPPGSCWCRGAGASPRMGSLCGVKAPSEGLAAIAPTAWASPPARIRVPGRSGRRTGAVQASRSCGQWPRRGWPTLEWQGRAARRKKPAWPRPRQCPGCPSTRLGRARRRQRATRMLASAGSAWIGRQRRGPMSVSLGEPVLRRYRTAPRRRAESDYAGGAPGPTCPKGITSFRGALVDGRTRAIRQGQGGPAATTSRRVATCGSPAAAVVGRHGHLLDGAGLGRIGRAPLAGAPINPLQPLRTDPAFIKWLRRPSLPPATNRALWQRCAEPTRFMVCPDYP